MTVAILFWTAVAVIVYTYVLFPAVLLVRARLRARPWRRAEITPAVSLIIVAHNEADSIEAKLENVLALDYPRDRLEVIVASDGSNDGTDEAVRRFEDRGVRLLARPREGKIPALNAAVAAAAGEVLVFSDADSVFAPDALRALVRPLAYPAVGCAAGNYVVKRAADNAGQCGYCGFDQRLKRWESAAGSATSASGAIYALRRALFQPVPPGVTDDFYASTGTIVQGRRLVFVPEAIAYEPGTARDRLEFHRKVRIINRGLCAVLARRALLDPRRYGFYAVQLLSHKVLRRLVVYPLLLLLAACALGWAQGPFYQAALAAQLGFYGLGAAGMLLEGTRPGRWKLFSLPYFFCLVNLAALWASVQVLRGRRIDRWETQRKDSPAPVAAGRTVEA